MRALLRLFKNMIAAVRKTLNAARLQHLGEGADIEPGVTFQYPDKIRIGAGTRIARHAILRANTDKNPGIQIGDKTLILESALINANEGQVSIGANAWLGPFCLIYGNGGVEIGDNVLIAAHSSINTVSHHADRCDVPMNDQGIYTDPVVIEDDVWIGLNASILQGVRIGKGSIIGAGAVVNKDIPPYSIAVGMPAKVLRKRDGAPE